MDNRSGNQNPEKGPSTPQRPARGQNPQTDKGEDAEDRQQAADRAWKDRQGVPRGTPEQGQRSADRVGGTGTNPSEPEIDDEANESPTKKDV